MRRCSSWALTLNYLRFDFNYNKLTNIMCETLTQFRPDQYFICLSSVTTDKVWSIRSMKGPDEAWLPFGLVKHAELRCVLFSSRASIPRVQDHGWYRCEISSSIRSGCQICLSSSFRLHSGASTTSRGGFGPQLGRQNQGRFPHCVYIHSMGLLFWFYCSWALSQMDHLSALWRVFLEEHLERCYLLSASHCWHSSAHTDVSSSYHSVCRTHLCSVSITFNFMTQICHSLLFNLTLNIWW